MGIIEVDGFSKDEEVDSSGSELVEDVVLKPRLVDTRLLMLNLLVASLPDARSLVAFCWLSQQIPDHSPLYCLLRWFLLLWSLWPNRSKMR